MYKVVYAKDFHALYLFFIVIIGLKNMTKNMTSYSFTDLSLTSLGKVFNVLKKITRIESIMVKTF